MALYKWSTLLAGIWAPEIPDWIVYLTQAEYDELSEGEKMNGTNYGIVWNADVDAINTLKKLISWDTETISLSTDPSWTYNMPEWTNLIYISWYWERDTSLWWCWINVLFARWLPNVQYLWQSWGNDSGRLCTVTVDRDSWNITITRKWDYWNFKDLKMTFC